MKEKLPKYFASRSSLGMLEHVEMLGNVGKDLDGM